jgi:hypothetical protein
MTQNGQCDTQWSFFLGDIFVRRNLPRYSVRLLFGMRGHATGVERRRYGLSPSGNAMQRKANKKAEAAISKTV